MQDEAVFLDRRGLAEGLAGEMFGRALLGAERDEAHSVGQAGFLKRPADTEGAHQRRCEIGNPFVGGERDHMLNVLSASAMAMFSA